MAISKFKATCLAAIDRVYKTGRTLVVTKYGKPVAHVVPPPPQPPSRSGFGAMAGTIKIVGDIEGPIPEEWWLPELEQDWNGGD